MRGGDSTMMIVMDGVHWMNDTGILEQWASEGHGVTVVSSILRMPAGVVKDQWIMVSHNQFMNWVAINDPRVNPWFDRKPLHFVALPGRL